MTLLMIHMSKWVAFLALIGLPNSNWLASRTVSPLALFTLSRQNFLILAERTNVIGGWHIY